MRLNKESEASGWFTLEGTRALEMSAGTRRVMEMFFSRGLR